jgi:hypothetical protein
VDFPIGYSNQSLKAPKTRESSSGGFSPRISQDTVSQKKGTSGKSGIFQTQPAEKDCIFCGAGTQGSNVDILGAMIRAGVDAPQLKKQFY